MAHFYGQLHGSAKSQASRVGSAASGISAHVRGWGVGVEVEGREVDGVDTFDVYATHGSNGGGHRELIATVRRVNGTVTWELAVVEESQKQ